MLVSMHCDSSFQAIIFIQQQNIKCSVTCTCIFHHRCTLYFINTWTHCSTIILLYFSYTLLGKQLHLVHSQVKGGAVYQVVPFSTNKLAISVNHAVCMLSWNEDQSVLEEECDYHNNILSLFLKTKGDFILVCCMLLFFFTYFCL